MGGGRGIEKIIMAVINMGNIGAVPHVGKCGEEWEWVNKRDFLHLLVARARADANHRARHIPDELEG